MGRIGKRTREARTAASDSGALVIVAMAKRIVRLRIIEPARDDRPEKCAEAHLSGDALDKVIRRLTLMRERLKDRK